MRPMCSVEEVRRAESMAGVPEPALMQRAAAELAAVCRQLLHAERGRLRGARAVALVGSGNNGGDALWALSMLGQRGVRTTVIGDPSRLHQQGAAAARASGARVLPWDDPAALTELAAADVALDGIVGIGGQGGLRDPAASLVELLNDLEVPVVAVDVPSGVAADTGLVAGLAVRADVTVCFGVLKVGLVAAPGRDHAGVVTVVDIGLSADDLRPAAHALSLADLVQTPPQPGVHKYTRGVVEVVAGSSDYPGAAVLAVAGARMAGAGFVSFRAGGRGQHGAPRSEERVAELVVTRFPDVVISGQRQPDARCVGPGLGAVRDVADHVLGLMADPAPLVMDASALAVIGRQDGRAALAQRSAAGAVTVVTPHEGEFASLGFTTTGGRLQAAQRGADELGVVLVLKGPGTVVAAPGSVAFVDTFGDASLATAGSGDVLSGLLAGMLAAEAARRSGILGGAAAALTAARAVALHGLAGRLAGAEGVPVTAVAVAERLADARAASA